MPSDSVSGVANPFDGIILKTLSQSGSQPSENGASLPPIYTTRGKDAPSDPDISPDVENCLEYLKVGREGGGDRTRELSGQPSRPEYSKTAHSLIHSHQEMF